MTAIASRRWHGPQDRSGLWFAAWGLVLLAGTLALRWQVDLAFAQNEPNLRAGALASGLAGLGLVFLVTLWALHRRAALLSRGWPLLALLVLGLAMRFAWLGSAPLFEDDAWRYLWDGALSAQGLNPYALPPQSVKIAPSFALNQNPLLAAQRALVEADPRALAVLHRINHPWLASLYPPLAQALFALNHKLAAFSLSGLQLFMLAWDVLTLGLFAWLLRAWGQPLFWLALYWWNPLIIEEAINSLHMDLFLLPFLALALLAARRGWRLLAGLGLVAAAGIKIWPLVLAPALIPWPKSGGWPARARYAGLVLVLLAASLALFWPMVLGIQAGQSAQSGLIAYAQRWEMNDSLFMLTKGLLHQGLSLDIKLAARLTRYAVAALVLGLALWFWLKPARDPATAVLWVSAALFLTSPTQFPWYYLWLFPALMLRPVWPLIALTALLPLYYWRFQAQAQDWVAWFDQGLVWLEFAPVLAGLAWSALRSRRRPPKSASTAPQAAELTES